MMLLTDGGENAGRVRLPEIIAGLPGENITINVLLFGQSADRRVLELQRLTQGSAFYAERNDPIATLRGMIALQGDSENKVEKPIEVRDSR